MQLSNLLGITALALLAPQTQATQTVHYDSSSFEAPTFTPGVFAGSNMFDGQEGWLATGDVFTAPDLSKIQVQSQVVKTGSQAVRIDATGQPTPYMHMRRNVQFSIPDAEPVLDIRFDMYIATAVSTPSEWSVQAQVSPMTGLLEWWIDQSNVLHMTDAVQGGMNTGFVVARDVWHNVITRVDYNTKTVEVLIDGQSAGIVQALSGIEWRYHAFTSLMFISPGDDQMYFDNFTLVTHDGGNSNITEFCAGDGSAASCPCGNLGQVGQGCSNSTGSGARLTASGSTQVGLDDLTFAANGLPSNVSTLLFFGNAQSNGGQGSPFGDGLLCASGSISRVGVASSNGAGNAQWGAGIASNFGLAAGDVRYFQAWYRDSVGSSCGSGFNTSNGIEAVFTP